MSSSFGGSPPDGLQVARQNALGLLTAAAASDDQTLIKDYMRSVIADGGNPLDFTLELLGGMAGVARILIELREEESGVPHGETLQELGRRITPPGE